jgi:hypothetical protein
MKTMVLDRAHSTFLVNSASVVKTDAEMEVAAAVTATDFSVAKSNPFVKWVAGDFAEGDNPNRNTQFWTAEDLELAEYTILHSPLNMVHKFRTPVGFFAETKTVQLADAAADDDEPTGSMKIQALSGLWTHIFPFEAAQVDAADDLGLLFYSMECRGTHLVCASDEARKLEGCGKKFDYLDTSSHCEHLLERTSVRHIVNPTFRGGALIVPPVKPGWQKATASVVTDAVMEEAAAFAEQTEDQYNALNSAGADLTASAWEQLMGLVVASAPGKGK